MSAESQAFRLPSGGRIDRSQMLNFHFDGRPYTGYRGDTLASALLANGVRLVGRSFKYHRPRGILSAGSEEPNALVELREGPRREPNTRATVVRLYEGLRASSQNRWPSLRFDLRAANACLAPLLAAGFYYKTFMWPASFWEKIYEPLIRRAAGLGRMSMLADPDTYEHAHAFCDVLVVGGGPSGLMAALTAARAGARVLICNEDPELGGRLLSETFTVDQMAGAVWSDRIAAELRSFAQVRILGNTTVFGVYDGATYAALEQVADHVAEPAAGVPRQRLWRIVAKTCVLASGAVERPLVFSGNDRPGVMLAGAVRSYVNRFGVAPGRRCVLVSNNDAAAGTVADLTATGIAVAALLDQRSRIPDEVRARAESAGVRVLTGAWVEHSIGGSALRAVKVSQAGHRPVTLDCDLLAMSGGWTPSIHLATHLGAKPEWNERIGAFLASSMPPGMRVSGAAAGALTLQSACETGAQAGAAAARDCGFQAPAVAAVAVTGEGDASAALFEFRGRRSKAFVDFQNDVTVADLEIAAREGFGAMEHAKRYTTLGMGTDQGKTSNVNAASLMAALERRSILELGTSTFRPPFTPVAIGALAGRRRSREYQPTRLPPTHAWAQAQGAVFIETGLWLRAQYFPRPGEADWLDTVKREVRSVRSGVGLCDVSTLGKIDVQGADAAAFLEGVYANTWRTLPVGRTRYGLMLREDGFVLDDGTAARIAEGRFIVTTTTANAERVYQHLEYCRQWLWPHLDVQLASVTEQWAQIALAGPRSRELLEAIVDAPFDVSNSAFPYLAAAELSVCGGTPARLFRVSFSGELAYEIAVPASLGDALARRLMERGSELDITPYGTEALGVMRIEKGHAAGAELNGQTTARDLGLEKLVSTKKDFIGREMAARAALTDPSRPTLVGLSPIDTRARLQAGAHLLPAARKETGRNSQGHVTSVCFSPLCDHWIGLGLLAHGPQRMGETVLAYDPVRGSEVPVRVVPPVFFDSTGDRLRG